MEKLTLLRSLEARGRPLGTERSTLPSRGARPEGRNEFARDVDEARRAERSETQRTDRKRAEQADSQERSRERSSVDEERGREAVDAERTPQLPTPSPEGALALGLQDPEVVEGAVEPLAEALLELEEGATGAEPDDAAPAAEGEEHPALGHGKRHTPSERTQATRDAGQAAIAAAKLADVAAAAARPVSLTQPASQGGTAPGTTALPSALGEGSLEAALLVAEAPQTDPTGTGFGSLEVEPIPATPPEIAEPVRSASLERVVAAVSTPTGAEAQPTVVEGGPRRDQATAIQPKAAPVQPPPPSPEQAASVLRQFRLHLSPGMRQATIQLQPAALGRIAIRITLRDGTARAEIRAESPAALEALERHVPELRAALENQGIEAGEIDLSLGFEQGNSNTPERFGDRQGSERTNNGEAASTLASAILTRSLLSETGVDTYA